MSFVSKIVALSLLSGAFASAPISLDLKPITRRQAAGEAPLKFSPASGFSTAVKIGANSYNLVVSTQDADTWVVSEQVSCNPPQGPPQGQPPPGPIPCKFGAKYKGSFAKMNGPILQGVSAVGVVGTETVTVGGITVPNQVIGLVTNTVGIDENVSGGLGLGSALQSDMGYTQNGSRLNYNPVFNNMIAQKLLPNPIVSVALSAAGGSVTFGGLPNGVNPASLAVAQQGADGWVVKADGFVLDGQTRPAQLTLGIDLSSPGTYLPKAISDAINAKIPGSKFRNTDGMYSVPCDAKGSGSAGVVLGGRAFTFDPADLVTKDMDVPSGCVSLIGAVNSQNDGTLGVNFLKTVVAVLDPTKKTISFGKK